LKLVRQLHELGEASYDDAAAAAPTDDLKRNNNSILHCQELKAVDCSVSYSIARNWSFIVLQTHAGSCMIQLRWQVLLNCSSSSSSSRECRGSILSELEERKERETAALCGVVEVSEVWDLGVARPDYFEQYIYHTELYERKEVREFVLCIIVAVVSEA